MSKRQNVLLLFGCLAVVALEFPKAVQQVRADWSGPWGPSAAPLRGGYQLTSLESALAPGSLDTEEQNSSVRLEATLKASFYSEEPEPAIVAVR